MWSLIILNIIRPVVHIILRWLYRMEFHGLENIPREGAVILTPNHISYLDPILVGVAVKRRLFFMTWNRMFDIPVLSQVMSIFGAFPVRLEGHDRTAIKRTNRHLKAGEGVVIFPEGGRTTTGKLDPFKPGAFRLAVRANVPIVPVTINGAYQVWPPKQTLPRLRGKIVIYYHPPIPPAATNTEEALKARVQEVMAQTRTRIISTLDPALVPADS